MVWDGQQHPVLFSDHELYLIKIDSAIAAGMINKRTRKHSPFYISILAREKKFTTGNTINKASVRNVRLEQR